MSGTITGEFGGRRKLYSFSFLVKIILGFLLVSHFSLLQNYLIWVKLENSGYFLRGQHLCPFCL